MSYVSPIKIGYDAEPEEGWTDKIGKYIAGEVDNLVLESCVKVECHVDKDELEKALRYDRDQYVKGYEDGKHDAAAAIEALEAEVLKLEERTKAQQGRLEDYMEKQLYIDHYGDKWMTSAKDVPTAAYNHGYMDGKNEAEQALEPKRERGEWKTDPHGIRWCSLCDSYYQDVGYGFNYCPNCGAKMEVQDGKRCD